LFYRIYRTRNKPWHFKAKKFIVAGDVMFRAKRGGKKNKMLPAGILAGVLLAFSIVAFAVFRGCGNKAGSFVDKTAAATDTGGDMEYIAGQERQNSENGNENESGATHPEASPELCANPGGQDFVFPIEGTRPYAVMIDNEGTRVLPQGGLNLAQVVYEIIVEGGETRFMPVFWGTKPEMVGPVRSSRHYFLDYAMEHDAIYVHFGWSPMAQRDISAFKINNINGVANGGEIFWDLTKEKNNWQDSYTSMAKIIEYVSKVKYRTTAAKKPVFSYNSKISAPEAEGQMASAIKISYSTGNTCGYEYDEKTMLYKRFRKGKPHMERVSGKQLEACNIIIQRVKNYTIKGDTAGRQEVETVGSGTGWFITAGKAVKITWTKKSRDSATRYADEKGMEIKLNPGQTWLQVVPLSAKVEIK